MDNVINIWEMGSRINVRITKEFLCRINNEIKRNHKTKRLFWNSLRNHKKVKFDSFRNMLKPSYMYFISLDIIVSCCSLLKIPLEDLQRSILSYKTSHGRNIISKPKLPIIVTPIFDMILSHHIADGFPIDPKNNRKVYFGYRQYDQKYKNLYFDKIRSVFGEIVYEKDYYTNKDNTQVYCPVVLSEIFFRYYGLNYNSYISDKARIPSFIFKKNWKYQLAVLIAFIIDEGYVDSTLIAIGLKNKGLIKDISKICGNLEYSYTLKLGKSEHDMDILYILKKGIKRLFKDYCRLFKEFPEIDMGWKGKKLRQGFLITERKIKRVKGNKKVIYDLLKDNSLRINEIATIIRMTRQGVRYHVKNLCKEGKISIGNYGKYNGFIYKATL